MVTSRPRASREPPAGSWERTTPARTLRSGRERSRTRLAACRARTRPAAWGLAARRLATRRLAVRRGAARHALARRAVARALGARGGLGPRGLAVALDPAVPPA